MGVGLSFLVSCVGAMDVIGALGYITDGLVRRNNGYDYANDGIDEPDDGNNTLDGFRNNVKEMIGKAPTSRVAGVTVAQDGVRYRDGYRVDDNIDEKQLDALAGRLKSLSEFAQGGAEIQKTPEPEALKPKTPEPEALKPKTPEPEPMAQKTPEPIPKTPEPDNMFKPVQPEPISAGADTLKSPSPTFILAPDGNKEKEEAISPKPTTPEPNASFLEEARVAEERNRATTPIESIALQKSSTTTDSRPLTVHIGEDKIVGSQLLDSPRPQTPMMEITEPECVQRQFTPHFEAPLERTEEPDANLLHTPVLFVDDGEKAGGSRHQRQRSESPSPRPIVRDDELRKTIKRSSFKSASSKEDREEELKLLTALEDEEMKALEENFVPLVYARTETESARHHPFNISPIMEGGSYATTSSEAENVEDLLSEKIPDMKNVDIAAPWSPQVVESPKPFNLLVKSQKLSIEEEQEEELASEDDEELKEIERVSREETQKWLDSEKFEHIDADQSESGGRSKRSAAFPVAGSPTPSSGRNSPFLSPTQEPVTSEFLGSDELNALQRIKDHAKAVDHLSVGIRRERSRSPDVTDDRIRHAATKANDVLQPDTHRAEFLAEIRNNKRALRNLDVGIARERSRSRSPSPSRSPVLEGNPLDRLSPITVPDSNSRPSSPTHEHVSRPIASPGLAAISNPTARAATPTVVPEIRLQDINAFTKQFDNDDDKEAEAELTSINFGAGAVKSPTPVSPESSGSSQRESLKKSKSNLKELVSTHRELQVDDDLSKGLLSPRLLSPAYAGSRSSSPSGRSTRSKSREPNYSDWYEKVFEPTIRSVSMERELDDDFDDDEIPDEIFDEPDVDDPGPLVLEPEKPKMEVDVSDEYCNDPQVQEFASYIKRLTKADTKDGSTSASFIAQEVRHVSSTAQGTIPKDRKSDDKKDEEMVEYYWKPGAKQVEPVTNVTLKSPPSPSPKDTSPKPVVLKPRRDSIIIPRNTMSVIDENVLFQEQREEEEYRALWGTRSPTRRSTTPEVYTSDSDYKHMQSYSKRVLRRARREESLNMRKDSLDSIIIPRFVPAATVDDYLLLQEEREAEAYREEWGMVIDPSRRNTTPAVILSKGDAAHAHANDELREKLEQAIAMGSPAPSTEHVLPLPGTPHNSRASSIAELPEAVQPTTSGSKKRRKSLKDSAKKNTLAPTEENKPTKRSRSPIDPNLDYIGDSLFPYSRK